LESQRRTIFLFEHRINPKKRCARFGPNAPEQFQEKCETVFRPELLQNKELERFAVSMKR
jgi:hypothetical protein